MAKTTPKTTKPAFMPSPRPRPRTSPEDAHQLASATGDLGFTRASNAPEAAQPEQSAHPRHTDAQGAKTPVAHSETPDSGTAPDPKAPSRVSSLKFEVPDAVWVALRQEALNRRVTVRYLVLEALAAKGYAVDLSTVPEDGRRLR